MKTPSINKITLRDYFAGQALAGDLDQGQHESTNYSDRVSWWHDPKKIAERAYAIADAMLEESDFDPT
jgi:hypothetical protein